MASSSDVPERFDVVINGEGFMFAEAEEVKAQFGYTPTFVPRSNTQGDYGDNFQDFWLTLTQRDFSLGSGQRFFRTDETRNRKFYTGTHVEVQDPGSVTITPAVVTATNAQTMYTACPYLGGTVFVGATSNGYQISDTGFVTSLGAHGLGTTPSRYGSVAPESGSTNHVYLTETAVGTAGVRKFDGTSWTTFSASPANALAFLNNTLYGLRYDNTKLVKWDTAGLQSDLYQWKGVAGETVIISEGKLHGYGGKVLIHLIVGNQSQLWSYDGTGAAIIAAMPPSFRGRDITVVTGIVYVSGYYSSGLQSVPAIMAYDGKNITEAWRGTRAATVTFPEPALAAYYNGFLFSNNFDGTLNYYNQSTAVAAPVATISSTAIAAPSSNGSFVFLHGQSTAISLWPSKSTTNTTATVTTSLFDGDSTLTKIFRGIKVDFSAATDGNGGTVDIAYRVGDVDGSYTTLQTGAASGTEYPLTNITGRSVSVKVTLNKGTSTYGPTLKQIAVRAAPVPGAFRKEVYILNLTGRDGGSHVALRDGTSLHPKDGKAQADALRTAATTTTPISFTDEFGTFTGIIDGEGFQIRRIRKHEYVAVVPVREV